MKPVAFIPPAAIALIGAIWLGGQSTTISRIEKENASLGGRITAHRSRPNQAAALTDGTPGDRAATAPGGKAKDSIDWESIASQLAEMQQDGGTGDLRAIIHLQQRLQAMTAEELLGTLDEIAATGLPDPAREMLEQLISASLIMKDPGLALQRFAPRLADDRGQWSWRLANALKGWAEKDPPEATGWFDREIAAGRFDSKSLDGKSQLRQNFEGALLAALISSDVTAAAARLEVLPEDQRGAVLSHHELSSLKEKDQAALARLIRGHLPEKDRPQAIANPARRLASAGYEKVTEYLSRISATSEERAATVAIATESRVSTLMHSKKITMTELDEMRAWASAEAPGSENKATGKALSQMAGYNDTAKFDQAAELVLRYHETTGSDEVLTSFLDGGWLPQGNKEAARQLAGKITDGKKRTEILNNLK